MKLTITIALLICSISGMAQTKKAAPTTYTVHFNSPQQVDSLFDILQQCEKYLKTSKMPVDEFGVTYPKIGPVFLFIVKQIQAREAFVADSVKVNPVKGVKP